MPDIPRDAGTATLTGPQAVRCARPALRALLADVDPAAVSTACLLADELVADADRRGAHFVHLRLRRGAEPLRVHLAVLRAEPVGRPGPLGPEAAAGRLLLEDLATGWGVETTPEGPVTWAALDLTDAAEDRDTARD